MEHTSTSPLKLSRPFLLLWAGEMISGVGSGMTAFALAVYIFQQNQRATDVSLVMLAAFLPPILLGPIAGTLADRHDRRLLMLIADGLSISGLLWILWHLSRGSLSLPNLMIGVTISALFGALLTPAYKAMVTDLLDRAHYDRAAGLMQVAGAASHLLAPALAGILLVTRGLVFILWLDVATFLITLSTLFILRYFLPAIKNKEHTAPLGVHFLQDGWRILKRHEGSLTVVYLLSVVTFLVGSVQTLYTPMLLDTADAQVLGFIRSTGAVGLLTFSFLLGARGIKGSLTRLLRRSLFLLGLFVLLLGSTTHLLVLTGATFLIFSTLPTINSSADVLLRRRIPPGEQGRAWGMVGMVSQLGYLLAYASAGILADRVFNPLMVAGGPLAGSIGHSIGTGSTRGIGLMFVLIGLLLMLLSLLLARSKGFASLEVSHDRQTLSQ